jgi:Fe-S oxidoreductase
VIKTMGGISTRRRFPLYAHVTFRDWFVGRPPSNENKPQVILWPDTFENLFYPEIAKAAVEVLEHSGDRVTIPNRPGLLLLTRRRRSYENKNHRGGG